MHVVRALNETSRRKTSLLFIFLLKVRWVRNTETIITFQVIQSLPLSLTIIKVKKQSKKKHFNVITVMFFWDMKANLISILNIVRDVPYSITSTQKRFPLYSSRWFGHNSGYISEREGGAMFATSYCLMFNFQPKLNMTPVTCLPSFGQI